MFDEMLAMIPQFVCLFVCLDICPTELLRASEVEERNNELLMRMKVDCKRI